MPYRLLFVINVSMSRVSIWTRPSGLAFLLGPE
jgi:hypothetical protein